MSEVEQLIERRYQVAQEEGLDVTRDQVARLVYSLMNLFENLDEIKLEE